MANYQTVAVCTLSTGLVDNVLWVDIDIDPPSGWPSNWITSTGKVNVATPGSTYVSILNGFVPPQPNPTFDLRTSDLTWWPAPDVYYYWTNPIEAYNLWNAFDETWESTDVLPPGATASEIVLAPTPEYTLTCSSPTVTPGDTVEVTLTNTNGLGSNGSVSYEILGPAALENVSQKYTYTVAPVPDTNPASDGFYRDGVLGFSPFLTNANNFEFIQDDSSNDGNTLLLSQTAGGTHQGGTVYETGVFYYLDGVQVANSAAYLAGFDAATTRKLSITVSPTLTGNLFPFSSQTKYFQSNLLTFSENTLGKYGGIFLDPLSGPSTLYLTVEPGYVPPGPTEITVQVYTGPDQILDVSFTILPL